MKNSWLWAHVIKLLSDYWLDFLQEHEQIYVGFSGGMDSTVLLHALAQYPLLIKKITTIHINHQLSANASNWQVHCEQYCQKLTIPLIVEKVTFKQSANIEENARKARYGFVKSIIKDNEVFLTAHHQNDQAETLMLQLCRGTGIDGLSAMLPIKKFGKGRLIRPLLTHPRELLQRYAEQNHLVWIEDESNSNCQFSRNFIRRTIFPQLQSRWPGVISNIAQTALHCQEARSQLESLANNDFPTIHTAKNLPLNDIIHLPSTRIKNVLRNWFKINGVSLPDASLLNRMLTELIFAKIDATPEIQWGENLLHRYKKTLYLSSSQGIYPMNQAWLDFPNALQLSENLGVLVISSADKGFSWPDNKSVSVKFRQGGEKFYWRGQHKTLKNLMQEWQIPPWLRNKVPLIYFDEELAIVVGHAISDLYFTQSTPAYKVNLTFSMINC